MTVKHHGCGSENVIWEKSGYKLAVPGETVEREGYCKKCGRRVKEVWIFACELIDE